MPTTLWLSFAVISLAGTTPAPIFPTEDVTPTSASEVSELPNVAKDSDDQGVRSSDIQFHVYSRSNPIKAEVLTLGSSLEDVDPLRDFSKALAIIIHGFTGSVSSKSVTLIRNALLYKHNMTVIALQWANLARGPWYDEAAENTAVVARYLANLLLRLQEKGLQLDQVHLIGFSLGAHVAGFTGSFLAGRIGRISGLDPARPGFDTRNSSGRLDPSDALFVLGLHTGSGFVSMPDAVGHVDFYPNGGSMQPHCQLEELPLICNHFMAYTYFAESIYQPDAFPSRLCSSWEEFQGGHCDANELATMGYHTLNRTRGLFFLRTNAQEPYGLGQISHHVNLDVNQSDPLNKPYSAHQEQPKSTPPPKKIGFNQEDVYNTNNSGSSMDVVEIQSLNDIKSTAVANSSKKLSCTIFLVSVMYFLVSPR